MFSTKIDSFLMEFLFFLDYVGFWSMWILISSCVIASVISVYLFFFHKFKNTDKENL